MASPIVPLSELMALVSVPCRVDPQQSYPNLEIYGFARGVFGKPPIDGAKTSASILYRVRGNQFIYSRLFAFEGAYAIVPEEMDGVFVFNEYPTFDVDHDRLLPRYLVWMFKRPEVWRQVAIGSKGMGDRRQRVHAEQVLGYGISLPPLDEQRRIVQRLDTVAALVEERRRAIEAVERETQALLLKAFQRAIDGAPLRHMSDVATLVRRPVEIDLDATYPELGVRSFGRGTFHKPDLLGSELSWQKLFLVQQGDLVFSNIKAWEGAFAVAGPYDHGRVGSHRYLTCVPVEELATAGFIWFYLQTHEGLGKVQAASPGSADRNRTLGQGALEAITVPAPPINRQHWFDRLQTMARESRAIRARTAQDVEALIPAMLHEIFNGKAAAA